MKHIKLIILTILLGGISINVAKGQQSQKEQDSLFNIKVAEFRKLKNVETKEQLYMNLKENFEPESSKKIQTNYNFLHSALAIAWLSEGNMDKFITYKKKTNSHVLLMFLLTEELEKMAKEGKNLEAALKISQDLLYDLGKQSEINKEDYSSLMHATLLHKCALVQLKLGNNEKGLEYIGKAYELYEKKEVGFIIQYSTFLSDNGLHKQALDVLSTAVKEGTSNDALTKLLRSAYAKYYGVTNGYDSFIALLNQTAMHKAYEEIKEKRVVSARAPEWTLSNLKGENISLSDLKGNIVVMDFWATWCGPCKLSFPGMQQAVDAYEDDPKVTFVFVSVGEKNETVQKFIKESGYRFNILLDKDKTVFKDYGITGIPAKIVIDPKGRIIYNSVGYSGSPGTTFNNMKAMIELIKND